MSLGGGKTKSTTTSEPWSAWQPYLKEVMSEAQTNYQGGAPTFWQGTANAGLTPEMQAALGGIWNRSQAGNPALAGAQASTGAVASGGMAGANPAYDFLLGQLYGPNGNPAMGYASDLAAGTGTNPALQYFNAEASGANVGKNPWLDATYKAAVDPLMKTYKESTVPALQSDYAMSGRYGSNAFRTALGNEQDKLGAAAGDLATKIYGGAYDADRNRQMQAMSGLSGAYGQDISSRIAAGQFLQGTYDTDLQRKLYAAQQTGQLGQQDISNMLQAAGMVPGLGQADYADLEQALKVGQYGQARSQAEQDLERQRFDYEQNADNQWLQNYAQMIYGAPLGNFGTQTTTQKTGGGGLGSILGGVMGIGSMIAGAPQIGAGWNFLFGGGGAK